MTIRIDDQTREQLDERREPGETTSDVIRRAIAAFLAGLVVLGLSACGGTEDPTDDVRAEVVAEQEAAEQEAIDAAVRAEAGECTPTGPGSEFRKLGSEVPPDDLEANQQWLSWLENAPEGCTERDRRWLSEAIVGVERVIDIIES